MNVRRLMFPTGIQRMVMAGTRILEEPCNVRSGELAEFKSGAMSWRIAPVKQYPAE
jgi:hypothetical protein